MKIKIKDNGMYSIPKRAHVTDVGMDVYSPIDIVIHSNETESIDLGFSLEIPNGYGGFICSRSSLSSKGLICDIPPIDPSYTGNIHAIIHNTSNKDYKIHKGDRIGQLVIIPIVIVDFVNELDSRGNGSFGSTGK